MLYNGDLGLALYLTSVVSYICFGFALLTRKNPSLPHRYLGVCFVLLGVAMLFCMLAERYWATGQVLRISDIAATALSGGSILFYCISLMQPQKLTRCYISIFIMLSVLFTVTLILCNHFLPGQAPHSLVEALSPPLSPKVICRLVGGVLFGLFEIYIAVVIINMYRRHKRFILENYSYREDIDLHWLTGIIYLFSCVAIMTFIRTVDTRDVIKALFNISMLAGGFSIYYLGSRQGNTPTSGMPSQTCRLGGEQPPSVVKPSLRHKEAKIDLINYFDQQKPYLNPELSLSETAYAVGTNVTYLSKLINGEFNVNFYTFVNNYRIDYAVTLIKQCEGCISSDELAAAAGFKSRSTFYEKFRQRMGSTPQQYMQENFTKKH